MERIIIILIILASFTSKVKGQSMLDAKLLDLEYNVFVARSDSDKTGYILDKLNLYIQNNVITAEAFREAQRINFILLKNKQQKKQFLWNASLLAHLNDDRDYARFYLSRYIELTGDTGMECLLLAVLINNGEDSVSLVSDTKKLAAVDREFGCLTCLNDLTFYKKGGRTQYLFASSVLPGLGTMFVGYPLKGAISTLVNFASGLAIYALIKSSLFINATLWGTTLVAKFYIGNIRLTDKLFYMKEAEEKNIIANNCENKISNLLQKYPLAFK